LSLPLAFGTEPATIPAPVLYIAAADGDIRLWPELLPRGRRRIGVVWAGDPAHDNDVNRSMRLKSLAPVFDMPDVDFISLQYKIGEKDVGTLQDFPNLFRLERSASTPAACPTSWSRARAAPFRRRKFPAASRNRSPVTMESSPTDAV
ncbi:MAG: hypothetical protein WBE82_23255, partial [Xanthobacteraceae bacterium]